MSTFVIGFNAILIVGMLLLVPAVLWLNKRIAEQEQENETLRRANGEDRDVAD